MKKLQKKSSFFALQSADEAVPDMQVMRRPGSGINTADITSGSSSNNDSNSSSSSSAISTNPAASSPSVARVKTLRRMQSKYNTLSSKDKPPPKEAAPVIPWNGGIYRGAATETINEKGVKISVPNGYGELTFPDGSVFEGIFEDGKRQNHGTLRFVGGSYIFGMWKDDKPDDSSLWKVIYPNGDEFWGTVTILKKDTHITNVNTLKKKEGEIHYHKSREKFFGTWKIDKHTGDTLRDGYGILSNSKGEKYYGEWKKDLFDGQGILFYRDGSYFVGKFSKGKRDGPGTMYFPNGDSIEGLWSDNSVNKATFRKGTPQDISMVSLSLAMQSVKEGLRSRRYQEITTTTASQFKWKLHINLHSKDWEDLQKRLAAWDVDPDSETSIQNSFSAALKEPCVASFLSLFKNSFHGAYFNSQNSTTHDLTHAKDDVDSFTRVLTDRLAECLRLTRRSSKDQLLFIASNYIQSLVYKTLFMLYKKEYDNEDFLLNQRLKELKNVTLSNMGVDIKFQPLSSSSPGHMSIAGISGLGGSHGSVSLHKKLSAGASMTDSPYSAAVREFVSIQWKETAHAKLEAISRMRDLIIQEMLEYRHQRGIMKEWQCSLDEICPVYTYVFIKSHDKLTDLKAQFQYIQDFKDSKQIELDPVNSTLAYFEGFFDFAFQIDSSFQDENGIVVPPNLLCEQLESIVNEQIRGFVSRKQPRPSFMWLPALLLQIGLDISENRLAEDDNCLVLNEELQEELENFIDLANAVLSKSQLGFRIIRSNHDSASSSTSSVGPSSASSSISSPPAVATPRSASFLTSTPALDNNARLHSKSMSFSSSSGGGGNSGVRHPIAFTPRTEAILLGAKSLDGTPAPQLTEEEMAILNNINNPQLLASAIATSTKRRSGQGNNRPTSAPAPVVSTTGEAADVVSSSLSINDIDSETTNNKNDDNSNNNNNSNSNDNSNSNSNNNSTTPSSPNNEENNNNNNSNNNTASSSDKGGDVADDSTTVDVDGVELDDDYDDLILVHFERKFAPHIYFKISHHMTKFLNEM